MTKTPFPFQPMNYPASHEAFAEINQTADQTIQKMQVFNSQVLTRAQQRELLSEIFLTPLPETSVIQPPFTTDYGRNIIIGEDVFINTGVHMSDLGGIVIEDQVLIGPYARLITVNHFEEPTLRRGVTTKPIHIQKNAWIGAGATILPGVTIGENAIVSANATVTKDVPANSLVVGTPAKILRTIKQE